MQELFPIASGLILGSGLGFIRPGVRLPLAIVAAVVLGALATILSGEFKVSWAYMLIDIPLVAGATLVGILVSARLLSPAIRR